MKIASISTILSALAALSAVPLHAASAEPVNITIGGYFTQSIQLVNAPNRRGNNIEDEVFAQDGEIHFKGKTTLANGSELGFRVELEASESDDQIDEHYLYLKGDWGKFILGAENGVGHLMQVRAPRFVPGLKMFDNRVTDDVYEEAYDLLLNNLDGGPDEADANVSIIDKAHMSTKLEHISGDANKLTFMTPRVGGLQLGISFAPNNADTGGGQNNAGHTRGSDVPDGQATQEDIVELGVSFKGMTNGIGYKFSYTGVEGDTVTNDAVKPKSTSTGLALQYGDWVLGGNISVYEDLYEVNLADYVDSEKIETVSYALKYNMGDSNVGIGMTESDETRGDASKTSYEEMMIGGGTKLTEGVSLGYYYTKTEASCQAAIAADTTDDEVSAYGITLHLRF